MALTKVSTGVVDMSTSTGGLVIAKGNDLERPASPSIGMIRESTETTPGKVEVYTDNSGTPGWQFLEEVGPTFVPLTDHPDHAATLAYRVALRDWPSTSDFPDTKPTL